MKPCVLKRKCTRHGKNDSAVAEVIGTVLIFAIAVSLFTTFILWYVPATGTANEQHYDQQTQNAFYKFSNELSDSRAVQGQMVSYSFPTGISGVPPFSPSTPTSISFSRNLDNFSSSMEYVITVSYTNSTGSVFYYNIPHGYSGKGVFKVSADTKFTPPTSYDFKDGFLIQVQERNNPATAIGPLPISLNVSSGGQVSLGSSLYNITGPSTTASSVGSTMLTLHYSSVEQTSMAVGELAAINGTLGTIDNITLNSYHYNISSSFVNQWNYAFFQQFNNSGSTFQKAAGLTFWNFTGLPFNTSITGEELSVSNSVRIALNSVDLTDIGRSVTSM